MFSNRGFNFRQILVLGILLGTGPAMAFNTGYHEAAKMARVSQVHQDLLNKKISVPRDLAKADEDIINFVIKNKNKNLKVNYTSDGISIFYKDMGLNLTIKAGEIYIAGVKVNFSKDLSATESMRNWAKKYVAKNNTASTRTRIFDYLVPQARAQVDPTTALAISVATGSGTLLPIGETVAGIAVGAAAMSGAMVVGVAVAAAVTVGAIGCETYALTSGMNGLSSSQKRLNCYTAPLSWIGVNPRDKLYLQSLECSPDGKINVRLESKAGATANRSFSFKGRHLVTVSNSYFEKPTHEAKKNQWNETQLKADNNKLAKYLDTEIGYYKGLCSEPAKLAEFNKNKSEVGRDILTNQPSSSKLGTQ